MKTSHVILIQSALSLCLSSAPAPAETSRDAHAQPSPSFQAAPPDGDGRQIAQVTPIWSGSAPVHPVPFSTAAGKKSAPVPAHAVSTQGWRKITISVPEEIAEVADFGKLQGTRLATIGRQGFMEVCKWLGILAKQLNAPPTITPAAQIYRDVPAQSTLKPVQLNNRPWYMPDGRMKTLVQN